MSLLSPFSPFSPGEGVGSKALTHQQVPFSPFISSLSSQLPLFLLSSLLPAPLFSILLPCLFTSSPFHSFPVPPFVFSCLFICLFIFFLGFAPTCPLFPRNPVFCLSLSHSLSLSPFLPLSLQFSIFPLSSDALPIYAPSSSHLFLLHCCLFHPPLPSFIPSFHFLFFSLLPFSVHLSFTPSVSLFWLLFALIVFRVHLEKWRGKRGEEEEGVKTRLPRARGTAYPYQASTCLLDPPGHAMLFT